MCCSSGDFGCGFPQAGEFLAPQTFRIMMSLTEHMRIRGYWWYRDVPGDDPADPRGVVDTLCEPSHQLERACEHHNGVLRAYFPSHQFSPRDHRKASLVQAEKSFKRARSKFYEETPRKYSPFIPPLTSIKIIIIIIFINIKIIIIVIAIVAILAKKAASSFSVVLLLPINPKPDQTCCDHAVQQVGQGHRAEERDY